MNRWFKYLTLILVLVGTLIITGIAVADDDTQTSRVYNFDDGKKVKKAHAELDRTSNQIKVEVETTAMPGHLYTLWWVIFNNPGECTDGCGEDDLGNPAVEAGVLWAAGAEAEDDGEASFTGMLDSGVAEPPPGEGLFGMLNADNGMAAEVHVVVRDHGPEQPDLRDDQLYTFAGGCTEDPTGLSVGALGDFECVDIQFAVFEPAD